MLANLKVPNRKVSNLSLPNLKVMLVCASLPLVVAAGAIAVLVTPPADAARPSATVSIAAGPAHSVTPAAPTPRSDLGQTTSERYNEMLQTLQSGDWFSQNGQPSQARSEYQKALKIAEALQHRQAQSVILTGLGRSYGEGGAAKGAAKGATKDTDYATAIGFYQQALALSDTDPAEAGRIRANLANAYRQQGQTQLALTTYQQALADVAGACW
jgi:tetratricopeptide (TPR) repeat protein